MTDYNFESPGANLTVQAQHQESRGGDQAYARFFYPGGYRKRSHGERLVQLRREEENASHLLIHGESRCRAFAPGYRFDLVEHYRDDMNTAYVLTEVRHQASLLEGYGSAVVAGAATYSNRFICLPLRVPYRPPRQTPWPSIQGPQTAFVVGPEGEELYVDKYGRVKVQFLWDRRGQWNERSSCWLRVAQVWAGSNWGAMFLPRVGHEVVVDFLHGDPDCPIITGRVYNARAMPPFALPRHQEWSGFMSNRLEGGGCHALVMDDRTKRLLLQSQGDMEVITDNDHYQIIQGTKRENVSQSAYLKIGSELVIEAGIELTIKAAGGFIKIDPSGITIQGNMVLINSGGVPGVIPGAPKEIKHLQPGNVDRVPHQESRR
jgi:type VI secretion system secreted protein VgrG